jgi:hypothetical protein
VLEKRDMARQRRLRQMQAGSRLVDAAQLGHAQEEFQ